MYNQFNFLKYIYKFYSKEIKDAWEVKLSIKGNLKQMGLAADPNELLKIPNSKREALENVCEVTATENFLEENFVAEKPSKIHVSENLEKDAKAPRERMFKLPKNQVQFITYMMDKYGDDYKVKYLYIKFFSLKSAKSNIFQSKYFFENIFSKFKYFSFLNKKRTINLLLFQYRKISLFGLHFFPNFSSNA